MVTPWGFQLPRRSAESRASTVFQLHGRKDKYTRWHSSSICSHAFLFLFGTSSSLAFATSTSFFIACIKLLLELHPSLIPPGSISTCSIFLPMYISSFVFLYSCHLYLPSIFPYPNGISNVQLLKFSHFLCCYFLHFHYYLQHPTSCHVHHCIHCLGKPTQHSVTLVVMLYDQSH